VNSVPFTLTPNVLSKCVSVICPKGKNSPRPALLCLRLSCRRLLKLAYH
jgi:hypothetical protein